MQLGSLSLMTSMCNPIAARCAGFTPRLFGRQITVENIHVRYEDADATNPFSIGLTLQHVKMYPWREDADPASASGDIKKSAGSQDAVESGDAVEATRSDDRKLRWRQLFKRSVCFMYLRVRTGSP